MRLHIGCGGEVRYGWPGGEAVKDGLTVQRCLKCGMLRTQSVNETLHYRAAVDLFPTKGAWEMLKEKQEKP